MALTTFGTVTSAGPRETTIDTALLAGTIVPPTGFWLITEPAATVVLFALLIAPTVRPAPVMADWAASCVALTTFGTATVTAAVTLTTPIAV